MKELSHYSIRFMKRVRWTVSRYRMTKKMTAQGPWSFPVSLESMVPMVTPYIRTENWLIG